LTEPKPCPFRILRWIAALICVGLVLLAGALWLNRRALARDALTDWLQARDLPSEAEVEAFGPNTLVARLRVGDPRNPEFSTERAEVRFRPTLAGVKVVSVTLRKPVLRVSVRDGRLAFGRLDPLVQEILRQPPSETLPRFSVDDGMLVLTTEYGPVSLTGDVLFDGNRLKTLTAGAGPTRLRGAGFDVTARSAALSLVTANAGVDLTVSADAPLVTLDAIRMYNSRMTLRARVPYPDRRTGRLDGPVTTRAEIISLQLVRPGQSLDQGALSAELVGQMTGGLADLALKGEIGARLTAASAKAGTSVAKGVQATASAPDFNWSRKGGDRLAATVKLAGGLEAMSAGDLALAAVTVRGSGPVTLAAAGPTARLAISANFRGGWRGGGAVTALDSPQVAAVKRAARGFRVSAPDVALTYGDRLGVTLGRPATLIPDRGGLVRLSPVSGRPLIGPRGGAFRLQTDGGGLPLIDADVSRLAVTDGVVTADGRLRAGGAAGPVEGGSLDAAGRLVLASGELRFQPDRCVLLKATRLEFGANDIDSPSARLCAAGGPLFAARGGSWRLAGRLEAAAATATFAQAQVDGAAATLEATFLNGRVNVRTRVASAMIRDTAPEARFNPLVLSGDISLTDFVWQAKLAARLPGGLSIGHVDLTHDMGLGFGLAVLDTDVLRFAPEGLQPIQLSPLAAAIGSPAVGSARFQGRFEWARQGAGSQGVLTVPGLDFQSAAGAVTGLRG
jgi:hypothetical protein